MKRIALTMCLSLTGASAWWSPKIGQSVASDGGRIGLVSNRLAAEAGSAAAALAYRRHIFYIIG